MLSVSDSRDFLCRQSGEYKSFQQDFQNSVLKKMWFYNPVPAIMNRLKIYCFIRDSKQKVWACADLADFLSGTPLAP